MVEFHRFRGGMNTTFPVSSCHALLCSRLSCRTWAHETIEMPVDPNLASLLINLASSLLYDLGKLAHLAAKGSEDPVQVAIRAAAQGQPDRGLVEEGLREWLRAASLIALFRKVETARDQVTPQAVMHSLSAAGDRPRQLSEDANAGRIVQVFLEELNAGVLRSAEGLAVVDHRAQDRYEHLSHQLGAINARLDEAPAFLTLGTYRDVLLGVDPQGYQVPYVRDDWDAGQAPVQQDTAALLSGVARVGLLTAPGGFGKSRLILELGMWAQRTQGTDVVVVDPRARGYAGHLRHLPGGQGRLLILVDNAEQANVPALLDELSKDPALRARTKVLALTRTTFGPELEQALMPYGNVSLDLAPLPTLKFAEAERLLHSLGMRGDDVKSTLYQRSNGVPLFLILSARRVATGKNFYGLPSESSLLDTYLDDQVELVDRAVRDPVAVRQVLRALAWLGRVEPESDHDLATLALLAGTEEATAAAVLQAGMEVHLIHARGRRFRFAYDLVRERMAVRTLDLAQALEWLKLFNFRERGGTYTALLANTVMLAFQRGESLDPLIQHYDALLDTLDVYERQAFATAILPAVRRADGGAALRWANRLIHEDLPPVTLKALGMQLEVTHQKLLPVVLEHIKPLVLVPEFQREVLALAVSVGAWANAALQRQVLELMRHAATPRLFNLDPLGGLDDLLQVTQGWASSSDAFLHLCALTVLERLALLDISDAVEVPGSRTMVNLRQARLPLDHPNFRALYTEVQRQVRELPAGALQTQAERLGTLLGHVVGQQAFFHPTAGSADEQAALEWIGAVGALAHRLPALALRQVARAIERLADTRQAAVAEAAQQVLAVLEADPIHHLVSLLSNAPSRRQLEDEEQFDFRVHAARRSEELRQQALRVTGNVSTDTCTDLVRQYHALNPDENLSTLFVALLSADAEYALAVHRALAENPDTRLKTLRLLHLFEQHVPQYVEDTTREVLISDDPNAVAAVMATVLARPGIEPAAFRDAIAQFARHPAPRVRSQLVQMDFWSADDQRFAVHEVLLAGHMDLEVGRAVMKALKDLGYRGVATNREDMRRVLEATVSFSLPDLTAHDEAWATMAADLATTDPLWLLGHIEARALMQQENHYMDEDIVGGLFDRIEAPSPLQTDRLTLHQQVFERLWGWGQQPTLTLTRRCASEIFARFAQVDLDGATAFMRRAIAEAPSADALHELLKWIFALPESMHVGILADEVVLQATRLQATAKDLRDLQASMVHSARPLLRSKVGRGPFPADVALKDLAEVRLQAAQVRALSADPDAMTLKSFWTGVLHTANRHIQATLDQELGWFDQENE